MSCSLRSRKTSKPASAIDADRVGPGGGEQLEAHLGHAEPRLAAASARRRATTRSSTSRARPSRSRSSMRLCSYQIGDPDATPWRRHHASSSRSTTAAAPGVGERGRAHLHGRRPGQQQLHRVLAGGHPAHAHDRQRRGRRRGRRRRPAPPPGGWPAPTVRRRPPPAGAGGFDGSMAMPITVLTRVSASAPASRAARRDLGEVGDVGAELGPAAAGRRRRPPRTTASPVAEAWANMRRRPSTLGQLRLTSTATTGRRRRPAGPRPPSRRPRR